MLILECSQGCYVVKIWPTDIDLWPGKSIGFQILLRTKYVPSLVKIHWRMLILECSQGCYGRTDGQRDSSVTISICNFVGEGIISCLSRDQVDSNSLVIQFLALIDFQVQPLSTMSSITTNNSDNWDKYVREGIKSISQIAGH